MADRSTFTLYNKADYEQTLINHINGTGSGDRIAIATTFFEPAAPAIQEIQQSLGAAASRSVNVLFALDASPFLLNEHGMPQRALITGKLPRQNALIRALDTLEDKGMRYAIINQPTQPFAHPARGRSHIKFAVINSDIFIGGCNLTTHEPVDIMAGWHDDHTANYLYALQESIMENSSVHAALKGNDGSVRISDTATLLLDAGIANRSSILDAALTLIDTAEEYAYITCQIFPHGITAEHLACAQARGVKVNIIYNHPNAHTFFLKLLQKKILHSAREKLPPNFFSNELPPHHPFLHAKLIVTDQGALVGSHNYVQAISRLGTAEIALLNTDPDFGLHAIGMIKNQLDRQ
jgi:hypothetical protein